MLTEVQMYCLKRRLKDMDDSEDAHFSVAVCRELIQLSEKCFALDAQLDRLAAICDGLVYYGMALNGIANSSYDRNFWRAISKDDGQCVKK